MKNKKIISLFLSLILLIGILPINFVKATSESNKKDLHSVACIFAGREKYLSILMPYLYKLQNDGKLTEIHFWQFTNNPSDIAYLDSISNLHKTSKNFTKYRTITPLIENNEVELKIKAANDAHILINDTYEIVLVGWGNTKSVIREGVQGVPMCEASCYGVLNQNEYKNFKISVKDNMLIVKDLMGARINDNEIKSIKIHTGYGSEGYWNYEETQNKNIKLFDTETRFGCLHWGEAYKYYLDYDFDLFIKIDDDIVYMDLDRYDEFVDYIINNPYNNCVFPNMINHSVSLFYDNKNNLIPNNILNESYINKNSPNDLYWYHTDGNNAKRIHEYFLNNISKFTSNNMHPINLDGHKESICMFGILKKNYNKIFDPSLKDKTIFWFNNAFKTSLDSFDDEVYVYNCPNNRLYPRFVVMHYQFGPQMKNGLDESFLDQYKKLALDIK